MFIPEISEPMPNPTDFCENRMGVINWDPISYMIGTNGQHLPAALILLHELGHAYHDLVKNNFYTNLADDDRAKWGNWDNAEEFYTIENIENKAAQELGIAWHRHDHLAAGFISGDSPFAE